MKTTPWQSANSISASSVIGVGQRLIITPEGGSPTEIGAVGSLFLAISYLRAKKRFTVSTLEGVEVLQNRSGKTVGDDDMLGALYLMDQSLLAEADRASHQTALRIASKVGIPIDDIET